MNNNRAYLKRKLNGNDKQNNDNNEESDEDYEKGQVSLLHKCCHCLDWIVFNLSGYCRAMAAF